VIVKGYYCAHVHRDPKVAMATNDYCEPDNESSCSSGNGSAQSPSCSPTKRATSADQLSLITNKHTKALALKSLFVEKVRGVKEFGQRLNKLGRHLSTSDQSELAAGPRLLSISSIDPDSELPRLVRTNAFKVSCYPSYYCK
jgi:hypothetical protein